MKNLSLAAPFQAYLEMKTPHDIDMEHHSVFTWNFQFNLN